MSDDDVGDADRQQHAGGDLAGEGTFLFPVKILRADGDVRAPGGMDGGIKRKVIRADDDFVAAFLVIGAVDQRQEIAEEVAGLVGRFVHLPVGGEHFLSHEAPFSKIAEVGSGCWDIFSAART